ncbi:MAG: SusD/RagB family nutrient-binding outer membrane lipoprotein [bacterium]
MSKILSGMIAIVLLSIPLSCSNVLDVNVNPLAASKADPNAVLPYVIVQYSNRKVTELGTRMVDVYQHSHFTFNSPRNGGGAAGGFLAGNFWSMIYTQVLANLALVEKDAKAAGVTNNNVAAIAVTLKALAFFDATCAFGDVPFTEALDASKFKFPKYDTQETVLRGVVSLLDEAIALIDALPTTGVANVAQGDLIYGGNMTNWRAYANSLKLRTLMLIRNKDTSVDPQIIATLAQPLVSTSANATMLRYPGTVGNRNAWLEIVTAFGTGSNETTNYFAPALRLRDLLLGDPRLALWCVTGTTAGTTGGFEVRGISQQPSAAFARYSNNLIRGTLPDIWMLPAEITFYRAELVAKGVIAGDANVLYRQGVTEALTFYGQTIPGAVTTLTNTQITTFVTGLSDINPLTTSEKLRRIGEQQYIETLLRPIEAWNHVRRTKVPNNLEPSPGSLITGMLKRLQYAPAERAANPNTPVDLLGDVPMWFEN